MDLRAHLLALLAPHQPGRELAPGVVLEDATTELGLRFRVVVHGQRVWVDIALLAPGQRYAARSEKFGFGYRTEGGRNPINSKLGEWVCQQIVKIVRTNESKVLGEITARAASEELSGARRIRHVHVQSLLELAGSAESPYYTVSPYMGCTIGCKFCYAQSNLAAVRRLVQLPDAPWGSYVDVRADAGDVLARDLASHRPLPIKFCPIVSDPYQAIEARERVTQACLRSIRDCPKVWPTMLLTRSRLILRDLELIAGLQQVFVAVSLPTVDDTTRAHFEPRAASVAERLEVLRVFRNAGVETGAIVQPLLPGPLIPMADTLAQHVSSVSIDVLRGVEGAGQEFADPRYRASADPKWQMERALALRELLVARGVDVWRGELPEKMIVYTSTS